LANIVAFSDGKCVLELKRKGSQYFVLACGIYWK